MSKRITAALTTGVVALALSVPAVSFANKGGTPNSHATSACKVDRDKGKQKGLHKGKPKKAGAKGNHCGIG
jgi:hypothetical protein